MSHQHAASSGPGGAREERWPPGPDDAVAQLAYLQSLVAESRRQAARRWWPYLVLWGAVWIGGYLGAGGGDERRVAPWALALALGSVGSLALGLRTRDDAPTPALLRQLQRLSGILFVAALALQPVLLHRAGAGALDAYWPFQIGVLYAVNGVFLGRPLLGLGAWLVAVAGVALALPAPFQAFWLAGAGGGALLLSGLLLRRWGAA